MQLPPTKKDKDSVKGNEGFSLVELFIVMTMIAIVTTFALTRFAQAQQGMRRANSARELIAYLERARLDSIRRRAMVPADMARVTVNSASSYTVVMDTNGDGILDPARTINIPAGQGAFTGTIPKLIMFNWRGRTVDNANNPAQALPVLLTNSYGTSTINVSGAGSATVDKTITVSPVVNSGAAAPGFRRDTKIP
jgi:prepilin-type N-terminal cleavage/methylation domain-containing protein